MLLPWWRQFLIFDIWRENICYFSSSNEINLGLFVSFHILLHWIKNKRLFMPNLSISSKFNKLTCYFNVRNGKWNEMFISLADHTNVFYATTYPFNLIVDWEYLLTLQKLRTKIKLFIYNVSKPNLR